MTDLSKLKAAMAAAAITADTTTTPSDNSAGADEKVYTKFTSTRKATRMFTTKGIRINFVNHQYITDIPDAIEYLRSEIIAGSRFLTEVGEITASDLDPMAVLRKQMYAEFLAEQEASALAKAQGKLPDMGSTAGAVDLKATTSDKVAN
jgi:hypothetical protein